MRRSLWLEQSQEGTEVRTGRCWDRLHRAWRLQEGLEFFLSEVEAMEGSERRRNIAGFKSPQVLLASVGRRDCGGISVS